MHTHRSSAFTARRTKKPFVPPQVERHARLAELTFSASMGNRILEPSTEYTGDVQIGRQL